MAKLDQHIEYSPDRVVVDEDNRIVSTPEYLTLSKEEEVKPLLAMAVPLEPTVASVLARELASRIELGKRVTYNGSDRSVSYEIIDIDSLYARLRLLEPEA